MTVKAKWYAIRKKAAIAAAAVGALAAAEILIYGDIGESWWEDTVTARQFVKELSEVEADQLTVRINSVGGSVPDGLAIYNAIKRHKATVTVEVDGMAFSIASLIAMAGDKVHMAANAMLMVHAPWTIAAGNSAQLRELAAELDTWAAAMSTSYAAKTLRPQAEMLTLVTDGKDHYYTAEEALAEKFIDGITDAVPVTAMASAAQLVMASRFRDVPPAFLEACGSVAAAAAPNVAHATQPQEPDMKFARLSILAAGLLMNAAGEHGSPSGGGTQPPASGGQPPQVTEAQRQEVLAADATRRNAIAAAFKPFMARDGAGALLAQLQADPTVTAEAAGHKLLALLGQESAPIAGGRVITTEDERDKIRNAQVNVLLARGNVRNPSDGKRVVVDGANPFRGHTLLDLARDALVRGGVRTDGMDKMQIVGAAFTQTSSDFPILLENTMHKSLQAGYALQPLTWRLWARQGTVSDFRAHPRYRRGSFSSLDTLNEAGEFKTKAVPDGEKAKIQAATKGNLVNLTRQAIINDDLDAFVGIAQDLGMAAARTVEIDAISVLTTNAALTQDNVALFNAAHNNIGSAGVISVVAFDEARQLMAKQTNVGGNDFLDLRPAVLLVPVALGGQARVINDAQYDPDTANKLQMPNRVRGLFQNVVDTPRLAGTTWYALADKDICPTVEVAFLDGNDQPFLDLMNGWEVDGAQWKVRLDYGTAAMDFRGAVRGPGA